MREIGALGSGLQPLHPLLRGEAPVPGLRLGEVVEAELLETLSQREGVLSIGGRAFRALHPEGLVAGQRLQLRLVSLGPPPVFKLPAAADEGVARLLLPPAQGVADALRAVLRAPGAEEPGGEALLASLRRLAELPAEPEPLAHALARLVRLSGAHHEADLARGEDPSDLKALVLRLLASRPEESVARAARSLLGHLEAHQARSLLEGALVVPLVLPWGEEWAQGELRVARDSGRTPGDPPGGSLRLRLQMPRLGSVEVRLRWGVPGVSVRLGFEAAALGEAEGLLPGLADRLVRDAGVRVADLRAEALQPPAPRGGPSLVEVVA